MQKEESHVHAISQGLHNYYIIIQRFTQKTRQTERRNLNLAQFNEAMD